MAARSPIVWISHKEEERCTGCKQSVGRGQVVQVTRADGLRCLPCAGLSDLVFLTAGDAALTRRATKHSDRHAVVLKYSTARKRKERQGVLVEPAALDQAKRECALDADRREKARQRRQRREPAAEREYAARFVDRILELFPGCPRHEASAVAARACEKHSGRVGRSRAAKQLDPESITLAVRAHVRHQHTRYDALLADGHEPHEARPLIREEVERTLERWRGGPDGQRSRSPNPTRQRR